MQKILVYEYITGGGLINEALTSHLLPEANLMMKSLNNNFRLSGKISHHYFEDYRLNRLQQKNKITIKNSQKIYDINFLKKFDAVLPIIPENNLELYKYIKFLEDNNIGVIASDSQTVLILSDKLKFYNFCKQQSINTIETYDVNDYKRLKSKNNYIIKDRYGAGCSHVKFQKKLFAKDILSHAKRVVQPFIKGTPYSLCLYFTNDSYIFLSLNRQILTQDKNGFINLKRIIVNSNDIHQLEIVRFLSKLKISLPGLKGYVGIDFIYDKSKITVVEVNPRLTTSFIGIYETIGVNYADLVINNNVFKKSISGKKYLVYA